MKARHYESAAADARETLHACGIPVGADFHTLRTEHVDALLREADRRRYQKPRNANGSRARYFHAMLQRRASRQEPRR